MISLLVPTRGRPDNVRRLATSVRETATTSVELVFYVDDDDLPSFEVVNAVGDQVISGPRVVLSEMWNRCAEIAHHDVMMHCGDDIVFRTSAWDQRILDVFDQAPDKLILVHGRDGFQDARLATHGFYHRRWGDVLGYFMPPYFSSDYNDLWMTEIADMVGRRIYLEDVYTEHMHPVIGKAPLDLTHQERLTRHQQDNVDQLYKDLINERLADAEKLRQAIAEYKA